jgi:hypothetical protein
LRVEGLVGLGFEFKSIGLRVYYLTEWFCVLGFGFCILDSIQGIGSDFKRSELFRHRV